MDLSFWASSLFMSANLYVFSEKSLSETSKFDWTIDNIRIEKISRFFE